jgi:hypothetical protein
MSATGSGQQTEGRFQMYRHAVIVAVLLMGAGAMRAAHATEITTYGSGLRPCGAYVEAREWDSTDVVGFTDWLGGYLSGVNTTSKHRNNLLGLADFRAAMYWLDAYCRAHPLVHFADAAGLMLLGAKSGPAAHSIDVTAYGSGYKSCGVYLETREQQSTKVFLQAHTLENVEGVEFIDWLGGYLSGVNAISSSTNNILGDSELIEAVNWLDNYCSAHPPALFSGAVEALVAAYHHDN